MFAMFALFFFACAIILVMYARGSIPAFIMYLFLFCVMFGAGMMLLGMHP